MVARVRVGTRAVGIVTVGMDGGRGVETLRVGALRVGMVGLGMLKLGALTPRKVGVDMEVMLMDGSPERIWGAENDGCAI